MIKNILKGISAYGGAFKLLNQLKLWRFFIIPVAISLMFWILIVSVSYTLSDNLGHYISNVWVWEWGKQVFTTISTVLSGLIIIVFGLILFKHTVLALSAPFMSPVSEKIEAHLLGNDHHFTARHRKTTFAAQLWRGIRINVRNLGMELLISIPILLLSFIPIINIFTTALLFIVQAYYAGFGNIDYTLERHFNYSDSLTFVRRHRGIAIGNGLVFILFLFIPILGVLFVLPLSVTAATVKTIDAFKALELNAAE